MKITHARNAARVAELRRRATFCHFRYADGTRAGTACVIETDDGCHLGMSYLNGGDQYHRKLGNTIAFGRAATSVLKMDRPKSRKFIAEVPSAEMLVAIRSVIATMDRAVVGGVARGVPCSLQTILQEAQPHYEGVMETIRLRREAEAAAV